MDGAGAGGTAVVPNLGDVKPTDLQETNEEKGHDMYGTTGVTAAAATTGAATLATTGIGAGWMLIGALTLMASGVALKSLVPKREF